MMKNTVDRSAERPARAADRIRASASELFYREGKNMMAVALPGGAAFNPGRAENLFEGDYALSQGFGKPDYDVTPDGSRFLMVRREAPEKPGPVEIQVVLNWTEELKRLGSTGR